MTTITLISRRSGKSTIARLMASKDIAEAIPNEKDRLQAVKNAIVHVDEGWPKVYRCQYIEPGPAHYEAPINETILIRMPALDKMAPTFPGKPVIFQDHKEVDAKTVSNGDADGVVGRVWKEDGWWCCDFVVWDVEAQKGIESRKFSVSCAYEPNDLGQGGKYHNVDYQEEVLDGVYTHLAIVKNPRYERAKIFVNSKGGRMDIWKLFRNKGENKNAVDLDPSKQMVDIDGEKVPLDDLLKSAIEAPPAPVPEELGDDAVVEHEGKSFTIGELKDAYRNKSNMKKNMDDKSEMEKKKKSDEKANAEKKNADDAAKAKADKEKEEAEKAEAKADKEKAESDLAEKEARENSLKKEKEDEEARKRAEGKKAFDNLKNAVQKRNGVPVMPKLVTIADRIEKGKNKYGSTH